MLLTFYKEITFAKELFLSYIAYIINNTLAEMFKKNGIVVANHIQWKPKPQRVDLNKYFMVYDVSPASALCFLISSTGLCPFRVLFHIKFRWWFIVNFGRANLCNFSVYIKKTVCRYLMCTYISNVILEAEKYQSVIWQNFHSYHRRLLLSKCMGVVLSPNNIKIR